MIDVHRLEILREVSRHSSLAGAARALRLTPSAVSQHVAALERSIGTSVVERSTRGVSLTPAGELLVETADAVAGELSEAERRLTQLADGRVGRLAVATFSSGGQGLLPVALLPLTVRPDVEVTAMEAEPPAAVELLRSGAADVALVYHFHTEAPPRAWRDLRYVPLVRDPIRAVLPEHHRLAARETLALSDLADEWWVHGWGECGDAMSLEAAAAGFTPRIACRGSDYFFVMSMVAGGVGVAFIPDVALGVVLDGVAVRPLRATPVRYLGALLPRRRPATSLARELVERLQEASPPSPTS